MRFRLVEAEKAEHSISRLCKVLGVTRQGFHAWRRRGPSLRQLGDDELAKLIVAIYDGSHQTYGAVRVNGELREEYGVRVGRKRVARLMRQRGIKGIPGQGRTKRTTIADAKAAPAPDLLERRFEADRPNALWLADITYVPTLEGWLFLGVVMDMWSRKIVGWSMRDDLKTDLVVDALAMAVTRRRPPAGVIHHEVPPLLRTSERLVRVALGDEGGALCHSGISGPTRRSFGVRRSAWSRRAAARSSRSPASSASARSRFGSGCGRTSSIAASATTG